MDEGVVPPNNALGNPSDSFMDLDYFDELLLEGCWLEAAGGSELLNNSSSALTAPLEPSCMWPMLEPKNRESSGSLSKDAEKDVQRSAFTLNPSISQSQGHNSTTGQSVSDNSNNAICHFGQSLNFSVEGLELSRRWWIGPQGPLSVMDRLFRALDYIKGCSQDKDVLVQIWVPENRGGKRVLTTNNLPCSFVNCLSLAQYRDISQNYQFTADEDSKEAVGLPGRVFVGKVPEWTPDVQFFKTEEYPRVGHAQQYNVRGTIAVPVFEQDSRNCLGVIEVVMTTQKIKYRSELENICTALEAVDLRSSEVLTTQTVQACDLSYQAALPELLKLLRSACETHGLPLAQTWVPCIQQGKAGCRHSDENLVRCVSTVDSACFVADPSVRGFHEACSEHHLLKGEGIVGKAFVTNQPCFSPDVTSFSKIDYPLSHHARMFGLRAAVSIRLRSISTGSSDFVLEFFLPLNCQNEYEHKKMLASLSLIIQNVCQTLRVITEEELQEETAPSVAQQSKEVPKPERAPSFKESREISSWVRTPTDVQPRGGVVSTYQEWKTMNSSHLNLKDSSSGKGVAAVENFGVSGEGSFSSAGKLGEKRRSKAEKTITLEILRQYFAGSLKDAAKSIGVCPTTLKRICRQHGIKRWPSRKIKKVGHSLQKIQRVIDSVQGASGSLQIDSFYSNFPELASPNTSRTGPLWNLKLPDQSKPSNSQVLTPQVAASKSPSSSCSQSSSSSQCCSSGTQSHSYKGNIPGHDHEEPSVKEESVECVVKRVRSDAELHLSSDGVKSLPRTLSHASLSCEVLKTESLAPAEKEGRRKYLGDAPRVKLTYGEEKIRFRMQKNWGYNDLVREIARRFGIDDWTGFQLKYLDDDTEWVLLTCDADLEECIDVCRSSQNQTVRLCLQRDSQVQHGSSLGSSSPLYL